MTKKNLKVPHKAGVTLEDHAVRFWSMVDKRGRDECWPWTAGRFSRKNGTKSYGAFSAGGHTFRAHRVAYELTRRPLLDGERACHSCDNEPCCNPRHLWAGSDGENVADRDGKGRSAHGERNGTAKLTPKIIAAIRADAGKQRDIAKRYGVCKSTIGYIKRRETWRHVG